MRIEIKGRAAELFIPVTAAGDADSFRSGLTPAGKVENQFVLAAGAFAAGLVEFGQEGAHIGRRTHQLIGGGQVRPTAEADVDVPGLVVDAGADDVQIRVLLDAECRGNLLTGGQQVKKNLPVGRVGAGVIGQEHAFTQRGAYGIGHHWLHVGLVS